MERQQEQGRTGEMVIITGASRSVGKQAGVMFAARGAKMVLAGRTVETDPNVRGMLGETLKQIEDAGGEAIAVATDLTRVDDLKNLVARTVERFGGVDILVNNTDATNGPICDTRFLDLTRERWEYQFDVNIHAPFTLMQL